MENLPLFISIFFVLTVILTITWFYLASKSKTFLAIAIGWAILQSIIALNGTYQNTATMPPPLMLYGVLPTLILIVSIFLTANGKAFIEKISLKTLTYFHSIRIAVEIILLLLFQHGTISKYMTFEGTNFDVFSGITAPIVAYLAFRKTINKKLLLGWNILCLLLLLNVVITSIFAVPSPFQQIAFDQPNIAILYFPFNLLPTVIVPTVLFAHFAAIKKLTA